MSVLDWISAVLLALGTFVAFTSAIGVLRLPDFYSRIHPAGSNDSLAQLLILLALLLQSTSWQVAVKLILISGFLLITTPSSTYAIARAAFIDGRKPWTEEPAPPTESTADTNAGELA